MDFRWNDWNLDHAQTHGVPCEDSEHVVRNAEAPFPRKTGGGKQVVWGRGSAGEVLQVVFLLDEDGTVYIIHARPLTGREKRSYRRIRR